MKSDSPRECQQPDHKHRPASGLRASVPHRGIAGFCDERYAHILAAKHGSRWELSSCAAISMLLQIGSAVECKAIADGGSERLSAAPIVWSRRSSREIRA